MRRQSLRITKVHHKPQKHYRNACALWRDALIAFDIGSVYLRGGDSVM